MNNKSAFRESNNYLKNWKYLTLLIHLKINAVKLIKVDMNLLLKLKGEGDKNVVVFDFFNLSV